MAILNRCNFNAIILSLKDKLHPMLNNLLIRKDGSTVTAARNVFMIVSPVRDEIKNRLHIDDNKLDEDVILHNDMVKTILKNLPKDTMFKGLLEHCDVGVTGKGRLKFTLHDGTNLIEMSGNKIVGSFIDYKKIFLRAIHSLTKKRVILNRLRLKMLLNAIDDVFPDTTGETPIYLDFTEDDELVIRVESKLTGQRLIGVVFNYKYNEAQWLKENEWEKGLKNEH